MNVQRTQTSVYLLWLNKDVMINMCVDMISDYRRHGWTTDSMTAIEQARSMRSVLLF